MRNSSTGLRLPVPLAMVAAAVLAACGSDAAPPTNDATPVPTVPPGQVQVLGSIPHDGAAWTEGLIVEDGVLWESTGNPTGSGVRAVDPATGEVVWSVPNGNAFFAEGVVRFSGRTYLLSWKEQTLYIFDRDAATPFQPFATYEGEGWGLTAIGDELVNSNGSATIYFRDPETFAINRTLDVAYEGQPIERLNELEYDGRYFWANQWKTRYVYRIDPEAPGQVARYELPSDFCYGGNPNGVAWDAGEAVFYVTGQRCDTILKVRFGEPLSFEHVPPRPFAARPALFYTREA